MSGWFKTDFASNIFDNKYSLFKGQGWDGKTNDIVTDVTHNHFNADDKEYLSRSILYHKFMPGGRYIYYAGRRARFYNNCLLLKGEEDTREEWGSLGKRASDCLMSGAGIGIDYSVFRPNGSPLGRTGGQSSGPIPLMNTINELGRNVMQGGSRRSAIYASLNWQHGDVQDFLKVKDWANQELVEGLTFKDLKEQDFNAHAPLDMTNISLNYDDEFLNAVKSGSLPQTFVDNVRYAMQNGEPGFSFNFGDKANETLRNAPVTARTKVLTREGYVTVGSIVDEPTELWTGKQWVEDVVFKLTKKDSDLVKVTLSNGRSISCSPEHPFIEKVYTGKGVNKKVSYKRTPACILFAGDKIESTTPVRSVESLVKRSDKSYAEGFVYGDGSVRGGRGEISVFSEDKKESFDYTCEALEAYTVSSESRAYFKTHAYTKGDYLEAQNSLVDKAYFIAGYFDADGCYTRDLLRLSCCDKDTLFTIQEWLSELGINSSVREDGSSSYKPCNKSYTLNVYSSSLVRFMEVIPTLRINIYKGSNWKPYRESEVRVVCVEELPYKEDVFCCDVGVEEHSFMAEGVIISNCTEVTSEDDSDICNLGSVNMGSIETIEEFREVVRIGSMFLVCGTLEADVPYDKVSAVREKNRRLGLGLMGVHEWLLKRGYRYEMNPEFEQWLQVYEEESERAANQLCDSMGISRPVAYRAIAPTGTIGILASTTTGIEPIYAVAYKRRYLVGGSTWKYQYVIDSTAESIIQESGIDPDSIECAADLASDPKRRIKFQYDVQKYVDMAISSTLNLPEWGSEVNNEDKVEDMAWYVANHAEGLRGLTFYPDGSRGGQPLTSVKYSEAKGQEGLEFEENSESACSGGVCGV